MSLQDVYLKISYNSDKDDILNDFYIPILSHSIEYKRSVGFFSSKSLSIAAEGIASFINNKGKIKLIIGAKLKKEDLLILREVVENPENIIQKFKCLKKTDLKTKIQNNPTITLGWLVAKGILEIKIAKTSENNTLKDEKKGLLHQKIGIFTDNEGNCLSFSGSNNETVSGWKSNIEEFKVFRSWKKSELPYFKTDLKKFEDIWTGNTQRIIVQDLKTAIKDESIDTVVVKEDLRSKNKKTRKEKVKLWDYQKKAIENWNNNGKKGIFEMATGTGKTYTALGCLEQELNNNRKLLTVISCPYQHLIQQWKHSIEKYGIIYDEIIIADSTNPSWKRDLANSILDIDLDDKEHVLVITTHLSFSSEYFIQTIRNKDDYPLFLIADEVHGLGAEISLKGLISEYYYRIGLSATPKRWFDEQGTDYIYNYFKGVVYEFTLPQAINNLNPATGETYLTPYEYKPYFINLESDELEEYLIKSKQIAAKYHSNKIDDVEILKKLFFARSNIIKNAQEKYGQLKTILEEIYDINFLIIYCSPQQIDHVMRIVSQKGIIAHRFTMAEGTRPEKKYQGLSERDYILKKFSEGEYEALVAIKCLDEGVDVPAARSAIFMSSSGNPREHIQRMGRVLRRFPDKEKAIIYDIIVKPSPRRTDPIIRDVEKKIFNKELERYEEIAKSALNNIEALEKIYKMKNGEI